MAFGPGWTATFVCTLRILTMSVELKGRSVCRMDCPITIEGLEHSAFRLVRDSGTIYKFIRLVINRF